MAITFDRREFQFMQEYCNEMYQSDMLRSGPMGSTIIAVRGLFLVRGPVTLTDAQRRFLLFALQDTFVTSHSSIVKSQLGMSMQLLRPTIVPTTTSEISDPGPTTYSDSVSGTYATEWHVMQSCMRKLGLVAPPPYQPLEVGPDGDPGAISTPMHHDPRDGTGYNHT